MTIRKDIESFLSTSLNKSANKERDKNLILDYFGFLEEAQPTLNELAYKHKVGANKGYNAERPRQIIKRRLSKEALIEMPSLQKAYKILKEKSVISCGDLSMELYDNGILENPNYHIKSLLNLLDFAGFKLPGDVYDMKIEKASAQSLKEKDFLVYVSNSDLKNAKKVAKTIRAFSRSVGIAKLSNLKSDKKWLSEYDELVNMFICNTPDIWSEKIDGEWYYMPEDSHSLITNLLSKIKFLTDSVDEGILPRVLRNAMNTRTPKKGQEYPSEEAIKVYLKGSRHVTFIDGRVVINLEPIEINDIDRDVQKVFKDKSFSQFTDIKEELIGMGYNLAYIIKALCYSPYVIVERTGKKGENMYASIIES